MEEVTLPAKRADELCQARVKGEYCDEPAGVGTKTPGVGRCYRHASSRSRRYLRWEDVEETYEGGQRGLAIRGSDRKPGASRRSSKPTSICAEVLRYTTRADAGR